MASKEHDIGRVSDFVPGTVYGIEVAGRACAVVRGGDRFFAVRDPCPHQGAALSGGTVAGDVPNCHVGQTQQYTRDGEVIRCPWHGWQFDLETGRSLVDPEHTRVRSYAVRVRNDRVFVVPGESGPPAAKLVVVGPHVLEIPSLGAHR